MITLVNTKRFTFSIVPRFSLGIWREQYITSVDFGPFCAEFIQRRDGDNDDNMLRRDITVS